MPSALTAADCGANGSVTPATSCPAASWCAGLVDGRRVGGVVEAPVVGVEHDAGRLAALAREAVVQDIGGVLGLDAGHPDAVVELAAGARLAGRRWRRRPRARRRAPGTGAGRCCGRGGTGMRSRGPPGVGPAACGTTTTIQERADLAPRRALNVRRFSGLRATSSPSRPRSNAAVNSSEPSAASAARAPAPRRRAGTRAPRRRPRPAAARPARAASPPAPGRRRPRRWRRARRSRPRPRPARSVSGSIAVPEPARISGPVELQRLGRRRGRGGVVAVGADAARPSRPGRGTSPARCAAGGRRRARAR